MFELMYKNKSLLIKYIFSFVIGFLFIGIGESGHAYPDLSVEPLKLNGLFQVPSGANSYVKNYSTSTNGQVVVITDAKNDQVGSIFSTDSNKLNFDKDFSAKMSIYLDNRTFNAGDGVVFVIHNDLDALNKFSGIVGAQLGVYSYGSTATSLLNNLKKSFAIEFDTYHNGSSLDGNVNYPPTFGHVAYAYPDKTSSYGVLPNKNVYLIHKGIYYPSKFLSSGNWHDLEIFWNSSTQELSYQFDDAPLVKEIIDVNSTFGSRTAYWGFTGSTGYNYQESVVAFTKIPGLVEISDDITIKNSNDTNIENTEVSSGEILTTNIAIKYNSGNQNLKNPVVNVTLGDNLDFIDGTVKLNDAIIDVKPDSNRTFKVPLDELSLENPDYSLTFETEATTSSTNAVDSFVSYQVTGDNLIGDTKAVNFKVIKKVDTTPPNGVVKTNLLVPVNGKIELKDMFSSVSDDSGTTNLKYSYVGTELDTTTSGKQTVTVRITDPSGNYSDYSVPVEVTPGNFGLLSSDTLNFGTFKSGITEKSIVLGTNQTVGISMEDQRGTKAGWRIQAKTSTFTPKSTTTGKAFTAGIKMPKGTVKSNGTTSTDLMTFDVTLNSALQNVISAPSGKGMNSWTYTLGTTSNPVSLVNIPTTVYVGDYQATLSWSMINAPS
ncbi:hypothetical protein ABID30_003276 [Enterococcus rotai]|uniref:lectin-like domain-containing protein n=1 Tax=Enterococcus rotai TaxID=118060 RepID=UPI00339ABA8C